MDPLQEQEMRVEKDLKNLARTLTADDLDADVMFAKKRGIRSCTPPLESPAAGNEALSERLKRVQPPPAEEK